MQGTLYFCCTAAFVSVLIASTLTPAVCKAAMRWGLFLDMPGERRVHTSPIPRCGGIAIFIAFHLTAALLFAHETFGALNHSFDRSDWLAFLCSSTFLLVIGLADDWRGISAKTKLLAQVGSATFLFAHGIRFEKIFGIPLPFELDYVLTVFWIISVVNAFNLIDGLDGLASGLALVGALGLSAMAFFLRHTGDAVLLVTVVGCCAGFLVYNFHPARVFLGDSGSMFLGLTLATLSLSMQAKSAAVASVGVPILAFGVPVLDTLLAIWRRSVRRISAPLPLPGKVRPGLFSADMDHLHHRLIRSGLTQRNVALAMYAASFLLVALGTLVLVFAEYSRGIVALGLVGFLYVTVRHVARTELWDSGLLIVRGLRRPQSKVVAVLAYPVMDVIFLCLALFASLWLTHSLGRNVRVERLWEHVKNQFFLTVPLWAGVSFLVLLVTKTYARVWSRARTADFVFLAVSLLIGASISFALSLLYRDVRPTVAHAVIFLALSTWTIVGSRAFPRAIHDLMAYFFLNQQKAPHGPRERILVYGAGLRSQLLLRELATGILGPKVTPHLVGFIDDDANLRRRNVFGYPVVGSGPEIPDLVRVHGVDRIIVSTDLEMFKLRSLCRWCADEGKAVSLWVVEERALVLDALEDAVNVEAVEAERGQTRAIEHG